MNTEADGARPAVNEEEALDVVAACQRITKMQRQLLQDTSSIRHDTTALSKEVSSEIENVQVTLAMLARSIATGQVKADEAHAETRRLISTRLDGIEGRLEADRADRAIERLFSAGLADALDAVDAVLQGASEAERTSRIYEALRMVDDKIAGVLRPFGVERMPIVVGESRFDDRLHDCSGTEPAEGCEEGVISAVHMHGYTLHGAPIRRAKVVVKGA